MVVESIEANGEPRSGGSDSAGLQVHVHIHLFGSHGAAGRDPAPAPPAIDLASRRGRNSRPMTIAAVLCGLALVVGWLATKPIGQDGAWPATERTVTKREPFPAPQVDVGTVRAVRSQGGPAAEDGQAAASPAPARPASKSGAAAFGLDD